MALPNPRVAVRKALADYLRTNLTAAWPNLVVSENWPTPQATFPPQALTVLAPHGGEVVEYHQPVVWQTTQTSVLYSYGKMTMPLQIDAWAQFEAVRDDLAAAVLPLLNRDPAATLGVSQTATFAQAPGLVITIPSYAAVTAEYHFDPLPQVIENPPAALTSEWRYVWMGDATIYLLQQEFQPLMKDVTILLGVNGAAPERVTSTYEGAVLADAPALYWRMGDVAGSTSASDIAGSAHIGAVTSPANVTFGSTSLISVGVDVNDLNTSAAASSALPSVKTTDALPISGAFTLDWWVRPTALAAGGNDIGQTASVFKVSQNADGSATVAVGGTSFSVPGVYVVGKTSYCALSYDGTTARFYLNGQLANSSAVGAPGAVNSFGFAQVGPWQGSVQEIALYPTALSAARILNHYLTGLNGPQ